MIRDDAYRITTDGRGASPAMTMVQPPTERPNLPDPPLRLAQATFRVAWLALVCTQLAWVVPVRAGGPVQGSGLHRWVMVGLGVVVALVASLALVAARGRLPLRCIVIFSTGSAVLALTAALHAFGSLVGSHRGTDVGPAGWVCVGLYGGVSALALFTASAVFEKWRGARRGSPELTRARARVDAALAGPTPQIPRPSPF